VIVNGFKVEVVHWLFGFWSERLPLVRGCRRL